MASYCFTVSFRDVMHLCFWIVAGVLCQKKDQTPTGIQLVDSKSLMRLNLHWRRNVLKLFLALMSWHLLQGIFFLFMQAGGPSWEVPLGRRDSTSASLSGSNNNIPAPNNTFDSILSKFQRQGLDLVDLVALSGSHTIGNSRCTSFRQRLYNQSGNNQPDSTLDQSYAAQLRNRCPKSGGDQNLFFLDFVSPTKFDNSYFKLLLASKGLLNSDQVLATKSQASLALVKQYAENNALFFDHFAKSMVKMGNISPLTGSSGEIRKNCRKINSS